VRYSEVPALNAAYELIANLFEPSAGPAEARPEEAMTISRALVELGEGRSWASVWFAYGALHHDLSDEALSRALELLAQVEGPAECKAAALMLDAEVRYSLAVYSETEPSHSDQVALMAEAVALVPNWPNLHVRLAREHLATGDRERAINHAREAMRLLEQRESGTKPFDSISGHSLSVDHVRAEFSELGLLVLGSN
jgi:tetratricopeptide (TPR) repeat protein